jgi:hypothetical protein
MAHVYPSERATRWSSPTTTNRRERTTMQDMTTWREVPRSAMYKTVITAVDAAKGEAVELGDESFVRLCDEELFPFLGAELERAREAERAGQ